MASMSAAQSAKQTARQMLTMAQDKARIAAAKTMKGETHVSNPAVGTACYMHMDATSFPPALLIESAARCNACLFQIRADYRQRLPLLRTIPPQLPAGTGHCNREGHLFIIPCGSQGEARPK